MEDRVSYRAEEYSQNIRSIRVWRGLRQIDVAKKLGISVGTYAKVESGQRILSDVLLTKLSEILNYPDFSVTLLKVGD